MYNLIEIYKNPNVSISIQRFDLDCLPNHFQAQFRVGIQRKQSVNVSTFPVHDAETAIELLNNYGGTLTFTSSDNKGVKNTFTTLTQKEFFENQQQKDFKLKENPNDHFFFLIASKSDNKTNSFETVFFIKEGLEFNFDTFKKWSNLIPSKNIKKSA